MAQYYAVACERVNIAGYDVYMHIEWSATAF